MKGWGRNGMFNLAKTEVFVLSGGLTTWVEVFSQRKGKRAPIAITGDTKDVLQWARRLVREIERQKAPEKVKASEENQLVR